MAPYTRHAEQRYMYIAGTRLCVSKAFARKKKPTQVVYRGLNAMPAAMLHIRRGACVSKYQRASLYAGCPLAYSSRSCARIVYTSRATCSFLRNRRYTTVTVNAGFSKTQSHQPGRSTYGDSGSGKDKFQFFVELLHVDLELQHNVSQAAPPSIPGIRKLTDLQMLEITSILSANADISSCVAHSDRWYSLRNCSLSSSSPRSFLQLLISFSISFEGRNSVSEVP